MFESASFTQALLPAIGSIATPVAQKLFGSWVSATLADRKEVEIALATAMDVWLGALCEHFRTVHGIDETQAIARFADTRKQLEDFFKDEEIHEQLMRPFTEADAELRLDDQLMQQRWDAGNLPALPEGLSMRTVNYRYLEQLKTHPEAVDVFKALLKALRPLADFDLEQYAKRFRDRYRTLELTALVAPDSDNMDLQRLLLNDVFVEPNAREAIPRRDIPRDYLKKSLEGDDAVTPRDDNGAREQLDARWRDADPEPVRQLLSAGSKPLVILGDPGSGKTTLCRDLCLKVLDNPAPPEGDWLSAFAAHLPLLIELRLYVQHCRDGRCGSFLEYMEDLGKAEGYALNAAGLRAHLRIHPSLVVFDGLDEVLDPPLRRRVTQEIIGFVHDYDAARVVVTSRIHAYDQRPLDTAGFRHLTLEELSSKQIKLFTAGWFRLALPQDETKAQQRQQQIQQALEGSPAIRTLAGNPLLLTIIAIVALHRQLPRERTRLYDQALRVLVFHWDKENKTIPETLLDDDGKIELLQRIAYAMSEAQDALSTNVISKDDLLRHIEDYLRAEYPKDCTTPKITARDTVDQLQARNFILCPQGPKLFGFVHRSFLDYLVACEIKTRFESRRTLSEEALQQLGRDHAHQEAWHEILKLLCGLLDPRIASGLIEAMVKQSKAFDVIQLALGCLGEVQKPHQAAAARTLVGKLLRERALDDADEDVRRAALGAIAEHYRDDSDSFPLLRERALKDESGLVRRAALRAIAEHYRDHPDSLPLLRERALKDESVWVRIAALGAIAEHYRDHPDSLPLLRERALKDESVWVRSAALGAIAEHYRDHPDSLPLLRERALKDESVWVRIAALSAIAEHYRDHPDSLPLLREGALKDEAGFVRSEALRAIAEHYRDYHDSLSLLRERALDDADEDVRSAALRAIAKHYRDHPDSLPLLRERALDDAHEGVRSEALRAIAKHYRDHPDSLPLLRERALDDAHEGVRSEALRAIAEHYRDYHDSLSLLRERALDDADEDVRSAALRAIAEHYRDDSDSLPLLRERALDDADEDVRNEALSAIAEHYRDHPDSLPLLRERALKDESGWVRSAALRAIAEHYRDDSDSLPLLRERALDDADEDVRSEALSAIAEHYRDHPDSLPLLRERALKDESGWVRSAALSAIAEHYRDHPDSLPLLRERALDDADEGVRSAALSAIAEHYRDHPDSLPLLRERALDDADERRSQRST